MKDSGFYVPDEKWDRFATLYGEDAQGQLTPVIGLAAAGLGDYKSQPTMPSGGGGMVSTREITRVLPKCFSMVANWMVFEFWLQRQCI
jgi:hypothetical protein